MAADLVTKILDDHELIRTRFSLLEQAGPGGRESQFRELVALLVQHEAVESILVHPTVEDHVPNGGQLARERLEEEQQAEERLAELEDMDPTTDVFLQAVIALRDEVEAHAAAEERETLRRLREHVDASVLEDLGERYDALKQTAPIRPHPESGQGPVSNLLGGPVLGMVDRAREAMRSAVGHAPADRAPAGSGGHAFEDWTVDQLQERAAELEIDGRSSMDKAELIAALRREQS